MNNPLASGKIICSLPVVSVYLCSSLSQFPNEMTHELILLNKGCPKCFSPHGQAQNPDSPNQSRPALTPRVLHLLMEEPRCALHCTKSCAQGAQFPLGPQHLTQVNTPLKGLQNITGSKHQSGSFHHPTTPSTVSVLLQLTRKRTSYGSEKIPDTVQVTALCLTQVHLLMIPSPEISFQSKA